MSGTSVEGQPFVEMDETSAFETFPGVAALSVTILIIKSFLF